MKKSKKKKLKKKLKKLMRWNDGKIDDLKKEIRNVRSRIPKDDSWYAPWR